MRVASASVHVRACVEHSGRARGVSRRLGLRSVRRLATNGFAYDAGDEKISDVFRDDIDDIPKSLRRWCVTTNGGVEADEADNQTLRDLVNKASTSCGETSMGSLAPGVVWKLLGCTQHKEPSPRSWLASPFFWFAKEAQHESFLLATSQEGDASYSNTNPVLKLAARVTSGWDECRTGEQWITSFGERNATAVFPFSIVESILNRADVAFESGEATLRFMSDGYDESTSSTDYSMESRIVVDFGNGRVVGDLVTQSEVAEDKNIKTVTLQTTKFENTGTVLDTVTVPSGAVMGALSVLSDALRSRNNRNGLPGIPYRFIEVNDGKKKIAIAVAGASTETETILIYERMDRVDA